MFSVIDSIKNRFFRYYTVIHKKTLHQNQVFPNKGWVFGPTYQESGYLRAHQTKNLSFKQRKNTIFYQLL